jgi:hypothetical protein
MVQHSNQVIWWFIDTTQGNSGFPRGKKGVQSTLLLYYRAVGEASCGALLRSVEQAKRGRRTGILRQEPTRPRQSPRDMIWEYEYCNVVILGKGDADIAQGLYYLIPLNIAEARRKKYLTSEAR